MIQGDFEIGDTMLSETLQICNYKEFITLQNEVEAEKKLIIKNLGELNEMIQDNTSNF